MRMRNLTLRLGRVLCAAALAASLGSAARAGAGVRPGRAAQAHSARDPTPRIAFSPS